MSRLFNLLPLLQPSAELSIELKNSDHLFSLWEERRSLTKEFFLFRRVSICGDRVRCHNVLRRRLSLISL